MARSRKVDLWKYRVSFILGRRYPFQPKIQGLSLRLGELVMNKILVRNSLVLISRILLRAIQQF